MDKLIGPLLVVSTLIGLVLLVLSAMWVLRKPPVTSFRKIALSFICLGAIVPGVITLAWWWTAKHGPRFAADAIERIAITLWPTSISLMALDSPGPLPWSDIAVVYAVSIIANIGLYGTVGLLVAWVYSHAARSRAVRLQRPAP